MRLWHAVIRAAGKPRIALIVSDDHLTMAVLVGSFEGLPGPVERWLRATTVSLRARADGPSRLGPADLRALYSKLMLDPKQRGVRLIEMTEPELTACSLEFATAFLSRDLAQATESDQELTAA